MKTQDNALATELSTERLHLRVPQAADAPRIAALIGDWEVARMLGTVPYPYPEDGGLDWVAKLHPKILSGSAAVFALVRRTMSDEGMIGCVGLEQREGKDAPDLGYWLGRPYWGCGLMTEAAAAVVAYGFQVFSNDRVLARHLPENEASGRVLAKLGFKAIGNERRWSRPLNCENTVTLLELRRDHRAEVMV